MQPAFVFWAASGLPGLMQAKGAKVEKSGQGLGQKWHWRALVIKKKGSLFLIRNN